ncbi:MAG: arylamine N-acetyltransferase [Candidimonas sp.]
MTATRLQDGAAYLERLGFASTPAATLETLAELQARHTARFPFETLANFLRDPVPIDLPFVERKILREGRGGYCFELNKLFLALLRQLGFDARPLTARVLIHARPGVPTARTHLLILVMLHGLPYITDVGFGGLVPTAPLRLDIVAPQPTPHEIFRIVPDAARYTLQALVDGDTRDLYVFDLQEQEEIDFTVGNWFVSTHPDSPFRDRLAASRTGPGYRKTLNNTEFAVHRPGAPATRLQLADAQSVVHTLRHDFGIAIPPKSEFHQRLEQAITSKLFLHAG